ncbi:MAG: HEAT repeat domain-containing protein [Limisphaerales bacterium]
MKRFPAQSLSLLAGAALLRVLPLPAAEIGPVLLRYTFSPGQTNAYSLQIEARGDTGREAVAGTFLVSSRSVATNLIGLSFRGQLRPKSMGGMQPMMGFRPGYPMPLSALAYGPQSQSRELVIDERGDIVQQAGDLALPIPLGQLMASLVQPLPAEATAGWETERDVFVTDEPLLQGPAAAFLNAQGGFGYGYFPGRPPQAVLAARQKNRMNVSEVTPATITLQQVLSLDSRMLTGLEPRVSATGEGRIVLDRALGLPERVELGCKTVVATEDLSRLSVLTLRWQLLEGAERDQAMAPPPPPPAPETSFTPEEMARLQDKLTSDDPAGRQAAARDLSGSRLATPSLGLLSLMVSLANDPDDTVRHAALTVLANHGAKEHAPLLIKALNDPDPGVRAAMAKGLGRLKDPRAIDALVNLLATGQDGQPNYRPPGESAAVEALARIGGAAEPAVLALLKERNIETRRQVCNLLKRIGTKKSLGPLKDLTLSSSKELSEAAAEACRSIQARQTSQ